MSNDPRPRCSRTSLHPPAASSQQPAVTTLSSGWAARILPRMRRRAPVGTRIWKVSPALPGLQCSRARVRYACLPRSHTVRHCTVLYCTVQHCLAFSPACLPACVLHMSSAPCPSTVLQCSGGTQHAESSDMVSHSQTASSTKCCVSSLSLSYCTVLYSTVHGCIGPATRTAPTFFPPLPKLLA